MPPQLWFKQFLVASILDGSNTYTVRAKRPTVTVGELAVACVGPSRPFALLKVLRISRIDPRTLPAARRASLRDIYGTDSADSPLWRVDFELVRPQDHY